MSGSEDDAQKTEEPTPRKLSEARNKGQVANSREVSNFAVLAVSAVVGQTGLIWTTDPLTPKLERISPLAGAKRLFSLKSVVELLKGIVKIALVAAIAYMLISPQIEEIEKYVQMDPLESFDELYFLVIKLFVGVVAVLAVLALADFLYQRYEFMKQMRMSIQEIRDEHKQSEGDPMIKSRLRQIRMERARARIMASVPQADVVITNPTHYSVALKYDLDSMGAPVVVAKGVDDVAFRIREVANENDIPIVPNPPLARALFDTVEIDQEIPDDHYKAVAEVISFVFKLKNRHAGAE
jgi:flagellar biosynthetic protein FlhB